MRKKTISLVALVLIVTNTTNAEEVWKSGWGQGVSEYSVSNGPGNEFYIACSEDSTNIMPMIIGDSAPPKSNISIIIDADEYEFGTDEKGHIPTDCHFCSDNFEALWNAIRKGQHMLVKFEDGRSSKFSLKGAGKAMPKEPCKTDWAR